jgi:Putative bacterial sensory transduction regulator
MESSSNAVEVLSDISLDMMLNLLEEQGLSGEVVGSNTGNPLIRLKIGGYTSGVYFYAEREGTPGYYRSIQFAAMFRQSLSLEDANRWNRERRYVKVYADADGQLAFEQDVSLDGGVTRRFLIERLNDWQRIFPAVLRFVAQQDP